MNALSTTIYRIMAFMNWSFSCGVTKVVGKFDISSIFIQAINSAGYFLFNATKMSAKTSTCVRNV